MAAVQEPCYVPGGMHMALIPWAVLTMVLYTFMYPAFVAYTLYKNRALVEEDQLLRAMDLGDTKLTNPRAWQFRKIYHRMYYLFKPNRVYWLLVILVRKAFVAVSSLMFMSNTTFQLAMVLLGLFVAYVLQVMYSPWMGNSDKPAIVEFYREEIRKAHAKGYDYHGVSLKDVKVPKKFNKEAKLGSEDSKKGMKAVASDAAEFVHNYNTVAATLLMSSIIVCLAGIMFNSGQFRSEHFNYQRDAITSLVFLMILGTISYVVSVFVYDMLMTVDPLWLQRRRERNQTKKFTAVTDRAEDSNQTMLQANPMFAKANAGDVGQKIDGTNLPLSDPDPEVWEAIRKRYAELWKDRAQILEQQTEQLEADAATKTRVISPLASMASNPAAARVAAARRKKGGGRRKEGGFQQKKARRYSMGSK